MQVLKCVLVVLVLVLCAEGAKRCYSGSKDHYESRQCDTGVNSNFVCQKFVCEGGKSPFILRTCANKNMNCMAGPAICKFSKGTGSCSRCDGDNSTTNFTVRSCIEKYIGDRENRCFSSDKVCADQGGTGVCKTCDDDLCNSAGRLSLLIVGFFSLFFI